VNSEGAAGGEFSLLDSYSKKVVDAKWGDKRFEFEIPLSVFSSYQLDLGSLRLLRVLESTGPKWERVLDLGCGYGLIAMHVAANGICRSPFGIDRDILGVEFARRNAGRNDLPQCSFAGGLAYEDVPPGQYSAVVSNIPAKAGEAAHRMMLLNAGALVGPGGEVWIVVIESLEAVVDSILGADGVSVTRKKKFNGHVVYSYRFERPVPLQPSYVPRRVSMKWEAHSLDVSVFEGLPDEDGPSPATGLLAACLARFSARSGCRRAAICDPGQGYLAVLFPAICREAGEVLLVSRDALGLRASALNLRSAAREMGVSTHHAVSYWTAGMGRDLDVFAAVLNKGEGVEIACFKIAEALEGSPGAVFIAACPASRRLRIVKALKALGVEAREEADRRGICVLKCAAER